MNNTVVRTLSGIVFLGIMVSAILLSHYTFIALTTVIIVLGMLEFYRMTIPKAGTIQKNLGIACGVILNLTAFLLIYKPLLATAASFLFILLFISIFISALYVKVEKPFELIAYAVVSIFYIAVPFSLMIVWNGHFYDGALSSEVVYNGIPILSYFIILWANDVGAYCFGMTLGRIGNHKLFPRHSPKKTWEGFIGGVLLSMVAGYLVSILLFDGSNTLKLVGLGLVISVFATFGDLIESMLKRSVGVKDSGKIMPGHGGILDRFDGVLLSFIPVCIYSIFVTL